MDSLNIDNRIAINDRDRTQIERRVQQEYKLVGQIKRIRGCKLFSLNINTGEIEEVEIQKTVIIGTDQKEHFSHRVNLNPHCLYRQCINKKNAERKFRRLIESL